MAKSTHFSCKGPSCIEWTQRLVEQRGSQVSLGVQLQRVWLIRGALPMDDGRSEQDYIDKAAAQGVPAMWVDSESDARAMAMEGEEAG